MIFYEYNSILGGRKLGRAEEVKWLRHIGDSGDIRFCSKGVKLVMRTIETVAVNAMRDPI